MKDRRVVIDYTNWRGERRERVVEPLGVLVFTHTEHHPKDEWLMLAQDVEKGDKRWFAMSGVHSMRPV